MASSSNTEGGVSPESVGHSSADGAPVVHLAAPSPGGVVRFVLIVVGCGIALYLAWRIRGVLTLVGISLFLALALLPIVDALDSRLPIPRSLLILFVYVMLTISVAVIGYVVVPSLVKEIEQISHRAPRYAADLRQTPSFATTTTATTSAGH